ncbi:MAG: peptide ABC transporter substrate-binding protein, partial [Rhabdochlamydiaceae bacterium]
MRINREGKLEQGIAQEVKISADQKTYLFKLRSTLWSNGSLVSAHDFEYAWKKVLSPTFKTPFAYLFYPIKNAKLAKSGSIPTDAIGIKAIDNLTLKVELEFPSPYFLELTAHTIYSPVHHLVDQRHPNWSLEDKGTYVCNGAFQLKKNNQNRDYELTKNKIYWDSENIKLDEVTILKANRYQAYEMFQRDINHWIGVPLGTWDSSFVPNENDERVAVIGTIVYWFVFNNQCFPFNHKKIRQALAWGINRSKLKDTIKVSPAFSPLPPVHSQVKHSILSTPCLEEAQALFKEALKELNMSLQDFPVISLTYLIGPIRNQIAHFIKEEWESAFGIRCNLESLEWKILFSKMTQGDFQVGSMTWESWINDPIYTLNAFRDANEPINFPKWENKHYQEIMHLAEREIDFEKRRSYYLQAEELLL